MKPINIKRNTYIDFGVENSDKDPKFEVGDHVTTSIFKNIFEKGYSTNWSEEVFVIKKVKNTVPWADVVENLNREEIVGAFYKKIISKNKSSRFYN